MIGTHKYNLLTSTILTNKLLCCNTVAAAMAVETAIHSFWRCHIHDRFLSSLLLGHSLGILSQCNECV